jgi:valyl-tRNA synthetase
VIDTVVELRNARSTAKLPAGDWLGMQIDPGPHRPTFEALAPAIERLARARPLALVDGAAALSRPEGALEVVLPSGGIEAVILPAAASDSATELDRARLAKELAEAESRLAAARARLANEGFVAKAPAAVVDGARASEQELAATVGRLRERLRV